MQQDTAVSVIDFWFDEAIKPLWFNSTADFDQQLRNRFSGLYQDAAAGKLADWEATSGGVLALVIMLDQFPLNMFRGQKEAFATEAMARDIAKRAMENEFDSELGDEQKAFLYMPLMHSESLADQDQAVARYKAAGLEFNLKFAEHHRDIVKRFGRFPHRNAVLQRQSTAEELEWLASDEAFKG